MIKPAKLELQASRNSDLRLTLTLSGFGESLSGYGIFMQVRSEEGAKGVPLVSLDSVGPNVNGSVLTWITTDGPNPQFEVHVDHTDWRNIPVLSGSVRILHYDLLLRAPDGEQQVYVYGPLTFREGVTVV